MTEAEIKNTRYDKGILFIAIGLVVFTQAVYGFYAIYDMSPPASFAILSYLTLFWLVGDWFLRDSKKHKIEWVHDMGFFLYLTWPIFIPYYLFKTRGIKTAVLITLGFILLYGSTYLVSYFLLYDLVP